ALQGHHLPDLLVGAVPPALALLWRRASIFCKAPLKKSTSNVFSASNCFTSRNCCCKVTFSSSPGVKFSPTAVGFHCGSKRRRHPYSRTRGTPNSSAKAEMLADTFIRSTAYCWNSSVYRPFLLFFCTLHLPSSAKCNVTHCLTFGVHSTSWQ